MRWLMLLVAVVLGAGITWLLTVRRVTRQVTPSSTPADQAAADEAAGFGGAATQESSSRMGWDRTSQDEDALFPHDVPTGGHEMTSAPPIVGATPNGDLAGVTAPLAGEDPAPKPVDQGPTLGDLGPEVGASERDEPEEGVTDPGDGERGATASGTSAPGDDDPQVPGPAGGR